VRQLVTGKDNSCYNFRGGSAQTTNDVSIFQSRNHFRQSYIMTFHKIMAPIFSRLGVKLITRNISQGGLGTLQNAIASGSIYGDKVDILIWDSGMTEKANRDHIDLFFRQGLIGGQHVPVIWSAGGTFDILKVLHEHADADVGEFGLGLDGIGCSVHEMLSG
jgi:hypothetical protein